MTGEMSWALLVQYGGNWYNIYNYALRFCRRICVGGYDKSDNDAS